MSVKERFSQTMRIDLIPDAPDTPEAGKGKRLVIAAPSRQRRVVLTSPSGEKDRSYNELLQSIYDAALICDLDGRVVDVNARAVEFFLYGREELCSLTAVDLISGADESLLKTLYDNLEDERYTLIQAYCMRKNRTVFPAEIAVNKLELGETRLAMFVRDITLRRQAEEMLRTEHYAIQNAGNGIAVADIEARLEYVNPAVVGMWGCDGYEDLLNRDVRDLLSDRNAASEMIGSVMSGGQPWSAEMQALRHDGTEFAVQVSAVSNRNADGEIIGIVFSFVDITDRKRAEDAVRESEQQRVMLESLGAACHHLGQPATVILANLGILKKRVDAIGDETVVKLVDSSIEAVTRLGEILHKLNTVNEYRTTAYLNESAEGGQGSSRILEI